MESFTLVGIAGWQLLSTLLQADATFKGKYLWSQLSIINRDGADSLIIKALPGTTAPITDSGITLSSTGDAFNWSTSGRGGPIDGKSIWIKCSGASTDFEITFVRWGGN